MIESDNSLQVFNIIIIGNFITLLLYVLYVIAYTAAFNNPPQDYKELLKIKKSKEFIKSDDSSNIDINIFF